MRYPLRSSLVILALGAGLGVHGQDAAYTLAQLGTIGKTLAAEKCYRPVEVKTSFIPNPRNREVADEMRSFDCRTFHVAIYRSLSASPAKEMPMSVVLEGAHPLAGGAWSVGAAAASVRSVLGSPLRVFGENLVYSLSPTRPGQDTLTFEVSKGIVEAVSWSWDVD